MRRLRIAHVITRLCKGGAQENTFHSVRLADRERFEVDLISGPTEGAEGSIEDAVRAAGIEILRVPELVREPNPLSDFRALWRLARIFKQRRYDIVHTHTSKAGFVGRLAARGAHVPAIVHTPHGNIFDGYFSPAKTRLFVILERYAARFTDRLIELTPGGIDEHLAIGIGRREQFDVIFSGIDLAPFDAAIARREQTRAALGIAPDQFLVGGVGRLEPVKGFEYFVEAARRVLERLPEARFILAGQGGLEGDLRRVAAPMGDRFRFLGGRSDVPELMAAMDAFVLPSLNEGMGRVLLEAGAAGTPSVAARVGGVPDIVRDGETGLLVAPRDAEAFAEGILRLARDAELHRAMGANARRFVVPAFGLERMVQQLETLYATVAKEKRLDGTQ